MSELKPCPFCGSKNIDESFARGFDKGDEKKPVIGAGCMGCGACAPMVTFPKNTTGYKESSEAWNQRANESQLQASDWDNEAKEIIKAVAHIGIDWGFGKYELEDKFIDMARKLYEADQGIQNPTITPPKEEE